MTNSIEDSRAKVGRYTLVFSLRNTEERERERLERRSGSSMYMLR